MASYTIRASGSNADLERLAQLTDGADVGLRRTDDGYVVADPRLIDGSDDVGAARDIALADIGAIRGLAALNGDPVGEIEVASIGSVDADGRAVQHIVLDSIIAERRLFAPASDIDRVRAHMDDPVISEALRHLADNTMQGAYRAVERIEQDLHGERKVIEREWVDAASYKQLKATANRAGPDARHASGRGAPPKKPMPLRKAREVAGDVIRGYSREKWPNG